MLTFVTTALVLLLRLFQVDLILTIIVLFVMPLLMKFIKKYTKKIRKSARLRQDTTGLVTAYIQETLSGIAVIKAFAREEKAVEDFKGVNEEEFRLSYKTKKIRAKVSPINEVLGTLMMAIVLAYGGYKVIKVESFTSGDLLSFLTALGLLQEPIKKLIKRNNELQGMMPSADRVIEILEVESEFQDREDSVEFKGLHGNVSFENISFTYQGATEPAVKNLSLDIKKGEVVAFVGKSGSGKTTLVNLIPRFYEIQEGSIKIDGVDTRDIKLKSLRKNIGIVPQETFLFSGTIASNIAYGRDDIQKEEIVKAAKMANAYGFIMEFEKGFDTEVGERGTLLSGGQKQRIAIARALIQNPEIMILDEATSALDTESERLVQDALDKLMKGRTTFVIAHRLSTIINADKIVVMEKGEIREIGTHSELLEKGGIYRKLYETQFGKID
jgi:ATP-binding cassette subfamily B protein/subfamily B ATP-binding cassette protein MsbA